ncbi:uncharacterized protein LOC143265512 [Megachile rotundata]|uniref:uncharacterized protein LOC143265512 n=1 Tax=Megachile rotundata TaxID=143995 RepID=UPI003FD69F7F
MPIERSPPKLDADVAVPILSESDAHKMASHASSSHVVRELAVEANEFLNLRMSTFWTEAPKLWFRQLEGEFQLHRIRSEDIKYSAVLRHLDQQTMKMVADVIEPPPEKDKYNTLKNALINRFTDSEERQLRKLLTGIELGAKKPSELLREMRMLAGSGVAERLLQTLWLQRLPQRVQELLSVVESGTELGKLVDLADKAVEKSEPMYASAIEHPSQNSFQTAIDAILSLVKQTAELSLQTQRSTHAMIEAMAKNQGVQQTHFRRKFRSRSRSRSQERSHNLCYYHERFRAKSWKCQPPCTWKGELCRQPEN